MTFRNAFHFLVLFSLYGTDLSSRACKRCSTARRSAIACTATAAASTAPTRRRCAPPTGPTRSDCHGAYRGSAEGFIAQAMPRLQAAGGACTRSPTSSIELHGDVAAVESSFLALQPSAARQRCETFLCGRYVDRFEKRERRVAGRRSHRRLRLDRGAHPSRSSRATTPHCSARASPTGAAGAADRGLRAAGRACAPDPEAELRRTAHAAPRAGAATCAGVRPQPLRQDRLACPRPARRSAGRASSPRRTKRSGLDGTTMRPYSGWSIHCSEPRACRCGSSITSVTVRTGAQGTRLPISSSNSSVLV